MTDTPGVAQGEHVQMVLHSAPTQTPIVSRYFYICIYNSLKLHEITIISSTIFRI